MSINKLIQLAMESVAERAMVSALIEN